MAKIYEFTRFAVPPPDVAITAFNILKDLNEQTNFEHRRLRKAQLLKRTTLATVMDGGL